MVGGASPLLWRPLFSWLLGRVMLCVACKALKHVISVWELVLVPSAGYDQVVNGILVQGTTSLIRVGLTTARASILHSCQPAVTLG